jgi:hypothetical protein
MTATAPPNGAADEARLRWRQKLWFPVCLLLITACGLGGAGSQSDPNNARYGTWLWDGSSWTQLAKTTEGKTFFAHQLLYSVALGGLIDMNGTKWNGSGWVKNEISPTRPPGNYAYPYQPTALVVDEANGQLLFFNPTEKAMLAWSVGSWAPVVTPAEWPDIGALGSGGVAYDPDRQEVLIVTYRSGDLVTSVWNGHAIITRARNSGLLLSRFLIVPDGHGHMLAFGQDDARGPTRSFSWDGKAWSPLTSAATLPRYVDSVAFDSAHQQILAVGSDDNGRISHTWRFQKSAWQVIATTSSPPGGRISTLIYDPVLRGFVITVVPAAGLGGII